MTAAGERFPRALHRRLFLPAYTAVEAARLAGTSSRTAAYWHYHSGTTVGPALPGKKRRVPLSYLELVEVAFVASFRQRGVALQRIRKAREYVAKRFSVEYPFAEYEFKTEGVHVLLELADIDPTFKGLIAADEAGQLAWREVILERFDQFEYEKDLAIRWYPRGKDKPIVIDPRIAFGAPIVVTAGIPTWVLKGRYEAGETLEEIEEDFGIRAEDVLAALEFEGLQLAA